MANHQLHSNNSSNKCSHQLKRLTRKIFVYFGHLSKNERSQLLKDPPHKSLIYLFLSKEEKSSAAATQKCSSHAVREFRQSNFFCLIYISRLPLTFFLARAINRDFLAARATQLELEGSHTVIDNSGFSQQQSYYT